MDPNLQVRKRECSKCMDLLNSILTKKTRVSKLLSAMNANIFTNQDTGEVGIHIDNSLDKNHHSTTQKERIHNQSKERISNPLTVATSPRVNLNEIGQYLLSEQNTQAPPPVQILCSWCGDSGAEGGARAYVKGPEPLSIVLCANRLSSRKEIHEVLVHELIHVYDVKFRGFDLR